MAVGQVGLGFENYGDHNSRGYVKGSSLWNNNEYDLPAACLVQQKLCVTLKVAHQTLRTGAEYMRSARDVGRCDAPRVQHRQPVGGVVREDHVGVLHRVAKGPGVAVGGGAGLVLVLVRPARQGGDRSVRP